MLTKKQVQSRVDWLREHFLDTQVEVDDLITGKPVRGRVDELIIHKRPDDINVEVEIVEDGKVRYRFHQLEEVRVIDGRSDT